MVKGSLFVEVINVDEFFFNKEVFLGVNGIVDDLLCCDDNFKYL